MASPPARMNSTSKVCRCSRARGERHTFATFDVQAATPLEVVWDVLGHATIQQTANTYMHGDQAVTVDWMQRFEQQLDRAAPEASRAPAN